MPKLAELGRNVQVLRDMRNRLMEQEAEKHLEEERWESFSEVVEEIRHACEERSLDGLASATRRLKNRLRRPAVRKALAEMDEKSGDDPSAKIPAKKETNPTGECKCSQCGKVIDGSEEPCLKDALCTDCALKKKVVSKKEQDREKRKKAVPPSPGMGPDQGGDQGGQQDGGQPQESRGLRRRKYLEHI